MNASDFLKAWLCGSTCHHHDRSIFWHSNCENFVILKHHGHSEPGGRWERPSRCGTYYSLYDIRAGMPDVLGEPRIKKWKGRWIKKYWIELEDLCK